MSQVPILVLREGTEQKREKEARERNVKAMKAVAEAVRSTLGPKGMDKMIVDSLGDSTITNDGAEILKQLDIENVSANMMVNLAKSIDDEIGDGTTSAVIFTASLLEKALELTEQGIHPQSITRGYKKAATKAISIVDQIAETISEEDEEMLLNAAKTAMNSRGVFSFKDFFADLALEAVRIVKGNKTLTDVNDIKLVKSPGKSLSDSELINGIYLKKGKEHMNMPDLITDAKIAVIRKKIKPGTGEYDANIKIQKPEDIQKFKDEEINMLKSYLKIFTDLGVDMVINSHDQADKFNAMLAKEGIVGIKNVGKDDIETVEKAVGAKLVDDVKNTSEEDLGYAQKVRFEEIGMDDYTIFEGCENPGSVTILLKGGLDNVLNTAEIAMHDVLSVLAHILDTKKVVAGGGATYIELSKKLKTYANEVSGKESLAINGFALALEEIPITLIRNAGLEEIERITELRAAHKTEEDKWIGIDTVADTIQNNLKYGLVEPAELPKSIIKSGNELATLILRIDRIIKSSSAEEEGFQP
ncbi:MAG: thermosome subunit beta [Promethearchaeia archaeon]